MQRLYKDLIVSQCEIGIISLTRKAFHIMILPRKSKLLSKNIKFHDAWRVI
jgi:hypothetical protein